jgi:hypothetical protein
VGVDVKRKIPVLRSFLFVLLAALLAASFIPVAGPAKAFAREGGAAWEPALAEDADAAEDNAGAQGGGAAGAQGGNPEGTAGGGALLEPQAVGDINIWIGATQIVVNGVLQSGLPAPLNTVGWDSSSATLTVPAGSYAGLTISENDTASDTPDTVTLHASGAVTFTGDSAQHPAGFAADSLAGNSGIVVASNNPPILTISGAGPVIVQAVDGQAPSNLGPLYGYPGIATNGDLNINTLVTTYGSDETGQDIIAGCGIFSAGKVSVTIWGEGLKAYGGDNANGDGGAGIDAYATVNLNGNLTAIGGAGKNGGAGIVAYDYPALMAQPPVSVDTAITVNGGLITATGGIGTDGAGGAGVLTPYSMSINNGAGVIGTGGVGTQYGGTGIAVATPIGANPSPDPGNGLISNNGGTIQGLGGAAASGSDGYGGAGLETSLLTITGGSGVTGIGGDGSGTGIGGPGVLASSDISVIGVNISTGAQLLGTGGDGGVGNGDGGAGITTNAAIEANNGASLTGVGGTGHGTGDGGDGVSTGQNLGVAVASQVHGTGGAAAGSGSGGSGVVTGVIRDPETGERTDVADVGTDTSVAGNGSSIEGLGGASASGSGGCGIAIGGGSPASAISAINGTRIVGTGGDGGNPDGRGGDGINAGGAVRPQHAPAIITSPGSSISGTGGAGGDSPDTGPGGEGGTGIETGDKGDIVPADPDSGGGTVEGSGGAGGDSGDGPGGDGGSGIETGGGDVTTDGGSTTGTGGSGGSGTEGGDGGSGIETGGGDVTTDDGGTVEGSGGAGGDSGDGPGGDGGSGIETGGGDVTTDDGSTTGTGGSGGSGAEGGDGGSGIETGGDTTITDGSTTGTGGSGGSGTEGGDGGSGIETGGDSTITGGDPTGVGGEGGSGTTGPGGDGGSGIETGGDTTINGGTSTATGGNGGDSDSGTGGAGGPGVGGGTGGGAVRIGGGTLDPHGGTGGTGGSGSGASGPLIDGVPLDSKGRPVYEVIVHIVGAPTYTVVDGLLVTNPDGSSYDTSDIRTDGKSLVHLWLPEGSVIKSVRIGSLVYPGAPYTVNRNPVQEAFFGPPAKSTPARSTLPSTGDNLLPLPLAAFMVLAGMGLAGAGLVRTATARIAARRRPRV